MEAVERSSDRLTPHEHRPMLDLIDTTKTYAQGRTPVTAVRGVSMTVAPGEFVTRGHVPRPPAEEGACR